MPPIIFSEASKVMSKISVYDLMTKCRVLLLIIGQNDINPKLLQPIVASIFKVMTVKKPCVHKGPTVSLILVYKEEHSLIPFSVWTQNARA